ncbi:MAG: slipin family protein [Elusimicrobiota bacterium]|nr:slipin family protein [Elusimicrobiota bacterium]
MAVIILIAVVILISAIRIVPEYERGVIFRLGRLVGAKGPGLFFIIPVVDKMQKVSLRTIVLDIPPQDVITKDNVPVSVNAVCYFRVMDPSKAVVEIQNYVMGTSQISQTTLRSIVGESELDEVLSQREKLNKKLQEIIDKSTDPWGIKVTMVEIKDVQIPQQMQRAIAAQAEAERDRRAKIINAEGEYQASEKLAAAAEVLSGSPIGIQLRFLRTVTEIAAENNSTTLFPIPVDIFQKLSAKLEKD